MSKISKTTITITILHPTEWASDRGPMDIEEWLYEMNHGEAVGQKTGSETVPVPDDAVESELIGLDNDGSFFENLLEGDGQ